MIPLAGGDRVSPATALARAHKDFRTDLQLADVSEADLERSNGGGGGKARGAVEVAAEAVGVGHGSGLQLFGVSEGFGGERRH
jgi:hypothetical protein